MDEVYINQEAYPYVLESDGTLDVAALQLQSATIVINRLATRPLQVADGSWPIGTDP